MLGLHHTLRLFLMLMADRRTSWWLKVCALSGLIYIFSPLDVIPDISGIGMLDDLIVTLMIMQAFIESVPPGLLRIHCNTLGIEPDQALIDVPRVVRDAVGLYKSISGRSWRLQPKAAEADGAPQPSYSRYSAYQEEEEQA